MNKSRSAHDRAMDLAFLADRARSQGAEEDATRLYEEALALEQKAIRDLETPVEPTHSVLHRSAAWLALDCGHKRLAEKLAAAGLAQEPPDDIAEELRDVWEQATFQRHLRVRGVALADNEIQISLSGPGVGKGVTQWKTYRERVDKSHTMLVRITERRAEKPFRKTGAPTKEIQEYLNPYVSLPRAASYAVTLKLGQGAQIPLSGILELPDITDVIDDFMSIVEVVNEGKGDSLADIIPDSLYRRNAIELAKKIAPDGSQIRQVGFSVSRSGQRRSIGFTRTRKEVSGAAGEVDVVGVKPVASPVAEKPVEVHGILLFAKAIDRDDNAIKVVDAQEKSHEFTVPPEMMDDIVRPLWNSSVSVRGVRRGRELILHEIESE